MLSCSCHLVSDDASAALDDADGVNRIVDPWHHHALVVSLILVALHREGLARACLAICEYRRVVALHNLPHHLRQPCLLENLPLACLLCKYLIELVQPTLLRLVIGVDSKMRAVRNRNSYSISLVASLMRMFD